MQRVQKKVRKKRRKSGAFGTWKAGSGQEILEPAWTQAEERAFVKAAAERISSEGKGDD